MLFLLRCYNQLMMRFTLKLFIGLLFVSAAGAQIPIKGGCVVGESQLAHALPAAVAEQHIKNYARLYAENYSGYKRKERTVRSKARSYMELDGWTQEDVIGFTADQRELLYISVGGELAMGKVDASQLPGFAAAIERKVYELEVQLGCEMPPPKDP